MKNLILILILLPALGLSQISKKELLDFALSKNWKLIDTEKPNKYNFTYDDPGGVIKEFIRMHNFKMIFILVIFRLYKLTDWEIKYPTF